MKLLAAIDFSEAMRGVMRETEMLAEALHAEVWLVHVAPPEPDFVGYDPGPQTERDLVARHRHQEHRQLQNMAAGMRERGIETTALMVQGVTSDEILKEADRVNADKGIRRVLAGCIFNHRLGLVPGLGAAVKKGEHVRKKRGGRSGHGRGPGLQGHNGPTVFGHGADLRQIIFFFKGHQLHDGLSCYFRMTAGWASGS